MSRTEAIERYLGAQIRAMQELPAGLAPRVRPFVTISRRAGAGGHALADSLVVAFEHQEDRDVFGGWQVFDRELCDIVADDPKYSNAFSALLAEEYSTKTRDFIRQIFGSTIDQDVLAHEVFKVVSAVASMGNCIILGRAGNEVTRGLDHRFSIRLVADEAVRTAGMGDYYGLDELAARREARRLDESRSRLLESHFHVDIDDPTRYDVVWNTGRVSMNMMADSVVVAIKHIIATAQPTSPK